MEVAGKPQMTLTTDEWSRARNALLRNQAISSEPNLSLFKWTKVVALIFRIRYSKFVTHFGFWENEDHA
ncbi:hypothetical protein K1719_021018 [Acacia pycnantha]|nr:hypothetical protein K1719_021018 [Acacia pycnantha]